MEMNDINAPRMGVQVQIRDDGKVLWVNVDGLCVLRVNNIPMLDVEDMRLTPREETALKKVAELPAGCPFSNYGGVARNSETCTCDPGWGHNAETWERFKTARP